MNPHYCHQLSLSSILALFLVLPLPAVDTRPGKPIARTYEVETKRNIAYYTGKDADKVRHKLDLYLPKGKTDCPVVLFVHGGAWVLGDKNFFGYNATMGKLFASHGVAAVLPNYRLSPAVKHPEHVRDVARAFRWAHQNIKRYGGRPDQLFVCGHSAGGHLISLLATDESYLKAEGLSLKDMRGAMPISGVYSLPDNLFTDVFGKDLKVRKAASPLSHARKGCPPFLILYAEKDFPLCDIMARDFGKALKSKGVSVEVRELKMRNHIDIISKMAEKDDPCAKSLLDFIARKIRP